MQQKLKEEKEKKGRSVVKERALRRSCNTVDAVSY